MERFWACFVLKLQEPMSSRAREFNLAHRRKEQKLLLERVRKKKKKKTMVSTIPSPFFTFTAQ